MGLEYLMHRQRFFSRYKILLLCSNLCVSATSEPGLCDNAKDMFRRHPGHNRESWHGKEHSHLLHICHLTRKMKIKGSLLQEVKVLDKSYFIVTFSDADFICGDWHRKLQSNHPIASVQGAFPSSLGSHWQWTAEMGSPLPLVVLAQRTAPNSGLSLDFLSKL